MNNNLTEIAYILDRSGSMGAMIEPSITGFNRFLAEQREATGEARLTLVLFDNEYLTPMVAAPLDEVPNLDTSTYVPRGSTALLDAIGRTIDELGARLATTPEPERPGQVIVTIFTDGYENASRIYDSRRISDMITHQREKYNWEFLFLAANQDAIATAAQLGIDRRMASSIAFEGRGVKASWASSSKRASALRHFAATGEMTKEYRKCLSTLYSESMSDEDL